VDIAHVVPRGRGDVEVAGLVGRAEPAELRDAAVSRRANRC